MNWIPLIFQLIFSYRPVASYFPLAIASTPTPHQLILGLIATPTVTPQFVGGDGQVYTIALLGDSMIQTLGVDIPALSSALQKYYPAVKFNLLNYGQGATTLKQASAKLPDILKQNPDLIVIESFAYNNYGNAPTGFKQHQSELNALIAAIQQQSPQTKILLTATIAPDSIHFAQGVLKLNSVDRLERSSTIKLYLQNLIDFANSQNLPLADAYRPSLINNNGNPDFISSADHLHPSPLGAQFFCDILAKAIFDHHLIQ